MNLPLEQASPAEEKQGAIARLGARLADWSEKWFPDAYVFAAIAVVIVAVAALAMGRKPVEISQDFGKSFWNLIPFTMQMAFVVIGGYIVAVSPPVRRAIDVLARFPKTPKVAVAYVAFLGHGRAPSRGGGLVLVPFGVVRVQAGSRISWQSGLMA